MSATCRLSPEEELLVLDKATRVCSEAMDAATKENEEGSAAHSSIGAQAGRCESCHITPQPCPCSFLTSGLGWPFRPL